MHGFREAHLEAAALRTELQGLMSFPVTPFASDGTLDLPRFRQHVASQLETPANALFVACGTGEFFSLTVDEHRRVIKAGVEEADGRVPVLAGVGYGTAMACEMTRQAEQAGASGVLVLPPYLVRASQEGLFEHYRQIAECSSLGIIPYQRDNAILDVHTVDRLCDLPQVVGLKDGAGDIDSLMRMRTVIGGRVRMMNGMPTAELSAQAFRTCGAETYSSAVLNFVPELAIAFHTAFVADDQPTLDRLLGGFFLPLVRLRDQGAGYAVSLVKAGVNLTCDPVGDVRLPLRPPTPDHVAQLEAIIGEGLDLL